ncbi:hypothetical protein [Flavobacterium sp. HNIBRBA15423]|uniref:hypothetical protein n=1 Tax=Flavobacterium sp. HNIBRBA15423 TaxID=3458683 RepID=UPI004044171D
MSKVYLILLIASTNLFSQDILKFDEIYTENNLTFKSNNRKLFTGIAEKYKHKNHLVLEVFFIEGIMEKGNVYFNGKKKIISETRFYYPTRRIKTKIKYSLDHTYKWFTHYNENEEKTLVEEFENGILKYKCNFYNGRKNGTEYCLKENGDEFENTYKDGKLTN